jgi:hypothetical protein
MPCSTWAGQDRRAPPPRAGLGRAARELSIFQDRPLFPALHCWGLGFGPRARRLALPDVSGFAVGPGFSCYAVRGREVACTGAVPPALETLAAGPATGHDRTAAVAVGRTFACSRARTGIVRCQGATDLGQLGDASNPDTAAIRPTPTAGLLSGVSL